MSLDKEWRSYYMGWVRPIKILFSCVSRYLEILHPLYEHIFLDQSVAVIANGKAEKDLKHGVD